MRAKIFSCHHVAPAAPIRSDLFGTFASNVPAPADGAFLSDLGHADTLAPHNRYAEMRQQYCVWKHHLAAYDYVGFEHYRRQLFLDPLPPERLGPFADVLTARRYFAGTRALGLRRDAAEYAQHVAMRGSLGPRDVADLHAWLGHFDVIVPVPNECPIAAQWKAAHDPACWDALTQRLAERWPDYAAVPDDVTKIYFLNIYVMRAALADEYWRFCFDVLDHVGARVPAHERDLGCLAERLFTIWLHRARVSRPLLRVVELPVIMHDPALDSPPAA